MHWFTLEVRYINRSVIHKGWNHIQLSVIGDSAQSSSLSNNNLENLSKIRSCSLHGTALVNRNPGSLLLKTKYTSQKQNLKTHRIVFFLSPPITWMCNVCTPRRAFGIQACVCVSVCMCGCVSAPSSQSCLSWAVLLPSYPSHTPHPHAISGLRSPRPSNRTTPKTPICPRPCTMWGVAQGEQAAHFILTANTGNRWVWGRMGCMERWHCYSVGVNDG